MTQLERRPGEALALPHAAVDLALWKDVALDLIEDGETPTLQLLTDKYGLEPQDALALIGHPTFSQLFHNLQIAIARTDFDRKAFQRLMGILDEGTDRAAISAARLLSELVGYRSDAPKVEVNLNLANAVKRVDSGEVIDAEFEPYPGAA